MLTEKWTEQWLNIQLLHKLENEDAESWLGLCATLNGIRSIQKIRRGIDFQHKEKKQ